ncbi:Macrophage migration inhibitory factor [Eumeta japonica]|uniref:L-dopachrome isomerase n=1 Tax=Eumeta variegata TaxID=151549 RepID=A0A4C1XU15_EUMVA|nr:Macrophage migration inhibitory factor [Eumeta japonica]
MFTKSILVAKLSSPRQRIPLRIETNVPKSKVPQDFVDKAIPILAKALGKPAQYCVVSVIPDLPMNFGGSSEPAAIANLMSIGSLGVEQNKKHAKVLFELVEKELGIPQDRCYCASHKTMVWTSAGPSFDQGVVKLFFSTLNTLLHGLEKTLHSLLPLGGNGFD